MNTSKGLDFVLISDPKFDTSYNFRKSRFSIFCFLRVDSIMIVYVLYYISNSSAMNREPWKSRIVVFLHNLSLAPAKSGII